METRVKEELPFQQGSVGLFQGDITGTSNDGPTNSPNTTSSGSSHSPRAGTSLAGLVKKAELQRVLSSAPPEIPDLDLSPKVSVRLSKTIPGERKEIADIKKETVTSEYSLEWWYDMGPTSPNLKHGDGLGSTGTDCKPMASIPREKSPKVEDCSFEVQNEVAETKLCKREYGEEDGVRDVRNDGDGRQLVKELHPTLETKFSERAVSALDNKMSSMSLANSPGGWDIEEEFPSQEEVALNLSIPRGKRDGPVHGQCQPMKEDTPFRKSHKANAELCDNVYFDNAIDCRAESEAQSEPLSLNTPEMSPAASTSFAQVTNPHHQSVTASSYFPWALGLCRTPIYAHPPMVTFTPLSMHSCTNAHSYPATRNQLPNGITGLPMPPGVSGHNGIDLVLTPTTRQLESFVAPYASLPLRHLGAVESSQGSAMQTGFQPVTTPNDQRQLSQPAGILLLTSQSICPQQFPFLPVTSQIGELSNQRLAKPVYSPVPDKLPIKRISAYVSKTRRGSSKGKSYFRREGISAQSIKTAEDRRSGNISEKANPHLETERPQKERSDSKADDPIKKGKTIRKTKFRKARDFVDPTMIKLSHDDEVSDDNELMTDFTNDGNNSSDEEWIPDDNEVKAGGIFSKGHEDSSSDEAEKRKDRKIRESRRNRSSICRRGRPISKAVACPTCGKVFHGKYHLTRHQMSHTETRPFECTTCGKKFKQKAHLQGHEMIHKRQRSKPKQKVVKSPVESQEEVVSNKFSGRPKKNYSEKELSCTTCQKSFKTLYRLKRHVQSHTDERPYSCRVCGKGFKQTGHRNEHEANHEKNRRKFLCNMCGVIFRCRSSFNNHLKGHRVELLPRLPRNTATRSSNPTGDQEHDIQCDYDFNRSGYDCPYCSDKFSTAQGLNRHLDSHSEVHQRLHVQPYTCKHCSRSFTYKHNMLKHMLAHLAPEKYALYHKAKLEQHVASGKPCYKCNTCSKMFIRKETLVKHSKIHTGCKPFKCMICSKEFSQNVHLKVHMRKHTGNRPFQCKRCNRGFIDSTSLAKHIEYEACIKENVFYICKMCDKRHYYLGSIKQHIIRHHGETEVEQHIQRVQKHRPKPKKTRNEKSPHSCHACPSTFTEKGNLARHVRRKHKDLMKMFHENISMGESSHSSLCSANSSTNNYCHEATSQSSEETRQDPNRMDTTGMTETCRDDGNEGQTEKGNSSDSERHPLDTECDSEYTTSNELPHDKIRSEGELLRLETANEDFFPPTSQRSVIQNLPEDKRQTIDTLSSSAAKPSDSGVIESHDKSDITDVGQMASCDIEITTSPGMAKITPTDSCHEPGKSNDGDVQARDVNEKDQDRSAVSFLYQFGLVASNKAKRDGGVVDEEMSTSWPSGQSNEFTRFSPESDLGKKGEEETTLKCFVSSKVDEEFGKHSDDGSLAIDLSGQSQQPPSDFELFCNLALMSENGGSSSLKADNSGSHQFSDAFGDSECTDCSDGCQSNAHDTCRQSRNSPDNGLVETDSCNKDPSKALRRRKGTGHKGGFSLSETYIRVKPWLHQLFGKAARFHKRIPRSSTRSMTAKAADGSKCEKNALTKEAVNDAHNKVQVEVQTRRTSRVPTVITRSMANESQTQCEKSLDEVQESSFEPEKALTGKTLSSVEGATKEVCAVNFESRSTPTIEDQPRHSPRNAVDSPDKKDTGTDAVFPPFVMTQPVTLHSENSQMQTNESFDNRPMIHLAEETNGQGVTPVTCPLAGTTDLSLSSKKSSKEATTQTLTPVELLPPGGVPSSPLTMTFLLRTSDDQLQTSTGIPVPVAGLSNCQTTPVRPKESFPCQECGKCFNARHQLKRHEMTHTEIRPYGCPECGRAFRQKVHLSDHLKRHGGQRPFACQACGKCFVLKNELKQHTKNYCRRSTSAETQTTWKRHQLFPVPLEGLPDLDRDA